MFGAIDGVLIPIEAPAGPPRFRQGFRSRKRDFALNVLVVSDARGRILYYDSTKPGSRHDAGVLADSSLRAFETNRVPDGFSLVGDSAYGNTTWLMPAFKTPTNRPLTMQETRMNVCISKARVKVENVFGAVKRRFAILKDRIRLSPSKASKVVGAVFALYNASIAWRLITSRPNRPRRTRVNLRMPLPPVNDPRAFLTAQL